MGTIPTHEDTESHEPKLRNVLSELPSYIAGRRASGPSTAALASNESHETPIPSVLASVVAGAEALNRYPDMGAVELRNRIAVTLGTAAEQITVGPGSVGVLQQILAATCEPNNEVIFAWRSFEAYPILVTLAGAVPVHVPLGPDEGHDLAAMRDAFTERTRVVIVCSPNNPTGATVDNESLSTFMASVPPHILVVIDEAYVEYVDEVDRVDGITLFRSYPNVCLLRTFSKAHGLAALRVGYAVAHPNLANALRKVALPFRRERTGPTGGHRFARRRLSSPRPSCLGDHERLRVAGALRRAGWHIPDNQANFIWIRATADLMTALKAAFDEADILVRAYEGDGVRITLADPVTNDKVLAVLIRFPPFQRQRLPNGSIPCRRKATVAGARTRRYLNLRQVGLIAPDLTSGAPEFLVRLIRKKYGYI